MYWKNNTTIKRTKIQKPYNFTYICTMNFLQKIFQKEIHKKSISPPNFTGFGNLSPIWLKFKGRVDYLNAYLTVPELNYIINLLTESFSLAKYKLYDVSGDKKELITEHKIYDLLKNPNPLQSEKEFLQQLYTYFNIDGNSYIFSGKPLGFSTGWENISTLWNLPSQYMDIKINNEVPVWASTDITEVVSSYVLNYGGISIFKPEDILHINEPSVNFSSDYNIIGQSRIESLKVPLSNINRAYEARNVILSKRGAIGILSNDDRDSVGKVPLTDDEKAKVQESFNEYGLSHDTWQIAITDANLKWIPLNWPIAELQLNEGLTKDTETIGNSYGVPFPLINQDRSTFDNQNTAQKRLYLDKIIPDAKLIEKSLNRFLMTSESNLYLELSYDHLEALQQDELQKNEIQALRSRTILDIQKSVRFGETSYDNGIAILIEVLGYSDENAKNLLSDTKRPDPEIE